MLGMELGSPASVIDAVSLPLPHVAPDQLDLTGSNPVPAVATAYLQAQELLIKQRWPKGLFYSGDAAPSTTGPMATSHRKIGGRILYERGLSSTQLPSHTSLGVPEKPSHN